MHPETLKYFKWPEMILCVAIKALRLNSTEETFQLIMDKKLSLACQTKKNTVYVQSLAHLKVKNLPALYQMQQYLETVSPYLIKNYKSYNYQDAHLFCIYLFFLKEAFVVYAWRMVPHIPKAESTKKKKIIKNSTKTHSTYKDSKNIKDQKNSNMISSISKDS